jgi:hypothetical protein
VLLLLVAAQFLYIVLQNGVDGVLQERPQREEKLQKKTNF